MCSVKFLAEQFLDYYCRRSRNKAPGYRNRWVYATVLTPRRERQYTAPTSTSFTAGAVPSNPRRRATFLPLQRRSDFSCDDQALENETTHITRKNSILSNLFNPKQILKLLVAFSLYSSTYRGSSVPIQGKCNGSEEKRTLAYYFKEPRATKTNITQPSIAGKRAEYRQLLTQSIQTKRLK